MEPLPSRMQKAPGAGGRFLVWAAGGSGWAAHALSRETVSTPFAGSPDPGAGPGSSWSLTEFLLSK